MSLEWASAAWSRRAFSTSALSPWPARSRLTRHSVAARTRSRSSGVGVRSAAAVTAVVVTAVAVVLFQLHARDARSRDRARGGQQAAQREGAQGGEEGVAVTSHAVLSERAPRE